MLGWVICIVLLLTTLVSILIFVVLALLLPPHLEFPVREDKMITGVNVLNPGMSVLKNQTIVIKHGIISKIRPTLASDRPSVCKGCFVIPGLI
jgi:Na+/H+-dicarboxylate symporter